MQIDARKQGLRGIATRVSLCAGVCAWVFAAGEAANGEDQSVIEGSPWKPPNVVFILVDDLGWAEPGCYGHRFNETPNIDRLAAEGMRFTTAYASSTVCSPSRAGLLTGQAPPRNGITDYLRPDAEWYLPLNPELGGFADHELPGNTRFRVDPSMVTLAQMFRIHKYTTGIIGKWHLSGYDNKGVKYGPARYGFDEVVLSEQVGIGGGSYFWPYTRVDPSVKPVLGEKEYLVDRMNHEAVEFIRRHASEPFLLYLSHYAVHTALAGKPEDVEHFSRKEGCGPASPRGAEWIPRNNPVLAAMLKSVDDGVGRIVQALRELDLDRSTMIVFTSDNGGEAQVTVNGHLRGGKSMTYEGGLRIPLVVWWPGRVPANTVCDVPTVNLDFYPTFAELLRHSVRAGHVLDGVSILSLLQGQAADKRLRDRPLAWHYPLERRHFLGGRSSAALRAGAWKLISFFDDQTRELYDLNADESERRNLIEKHPGRAADLGSMFDAWLLDVGGTIPGSVSPPAGAAGGP